MKWGIAVAVVLAVACASCLGRTQAGECTYDGLTAKCGELLVQLNKNYRTDEAPLDGGFARPDSRRGRQHPHGRCRSWGHPREI